MVELSESTEHAQSTVLRIGAELPSLGTSHLSTLARFIDERNGQQAQIAARAADLARLVNEPIQRLLEASSSAKAALVELRDSRIAELQARMTNRSVARVFDGPSVINLLPKLHAGINIFAPPYDFEVRGPNSGQVTVTSDRQAGIYSVALSWGHGGARFATAGIGLALQAGATGVVHVRPAWHFDYQASANGHWLGAHTDGAGRLVFQDAITGTVLKEVMQPLWNFNEDHSEGREGYVDSWALGADLFVQDGQMFTVTLLATAMVDDSGTDHWFGWSLASAFMEMRLPLLVAEFGPS